MGTTYKVHEKDGLLIELDEMSNKFSLDMEGDISIAEEDEDDPKSAYSRRVLTPDDTIKMALQMLVVASYWCDEDDFAKSVREWRNSPRSYEGTLLRSIGQVGAEE